MICFRLLESDDPATPLAEAVATLRRGEDAESVYAVNPKSFRQVPNAPFAYWVSERIRGLFTELPPFESDSRTAKQGLATADDFRFVRTAWETPEKGTHKAWFPFAKGGSYSPFYADIHLHVNWINGGNEIRFFGDNNGIRTRSRPQNTSYYFRPGYTYPLRTAKFSPQVLPKGVVISVRGSGIYGETHLSSLGIMSSCVFDALLKIVVGRFAHPQFDMGDINLTPVPRTFSKNSSEANAKSAWSLKRHLDTTNSNSHAFYAPALRPTATSTPTTASDA